MFFDIAAIDCQGYCAYNFVYIGSANIHNYYCDKAKSRLGHVCKMKNQQFEQ